MDNASDEHSLCEEAQRALVLLEKSIKAHKSEIKPLENNVENLELVTRRQLEQIVINESQYKELSERSEMQHVKNVKEINSLKKTNGELLERLNSLRNTMETTTFSSTLFDSQTKIDEIDDDVNDAVLNIDDELLFNDTVVNVDDYKQRKQ
ncbi:15324_t:CDS:2 [Entrophospora sp. SA101]|nr:15324_t:CDS:2 [Entrophospora sp. SA101]